MSEKVTAMIEEIKGLTVLELSELVHALEEEFGVSAAAGVVVAAAGAGAAAEEEKTEENTAAEEVDKTQTDASVTDDTKLPTDEEQTIAPETVTDPTEEDQKEKKEDEEEPEAFNEEYQDGQVIIRVEADPGVVPNGTELSVKKIVQQDLEALDDEEEIKEAEELNAKYEGIKSELELT